MSMTVTVSADGLSITMKMKSWSATVLIEDVPGWIEMYEEIRDRKKHRYRKNVEEKGRAYLAKPESSTLLYEDCARRLKEALLLADGKGCSDAG